MSLSRVPRHSWRALSPPSPPIRAIQDAVCEAYGVSLVDLVSQRRQASVVTARHVAMWLAYRHTPLSYPTIGRAFGDRDHTTVMYGVGRVEQRMAEDDVFAYRIRRLEASLDDRADVRRVG
jgi:chromosomal replication initiator protein